jgi:hypothetical protein
VRVVAHYEADPDAPALAAADTPDQEVGVVLHEGTPRGSGPPPTRTKRVASVAGAGGQATILVPPFASEVAVYVTDPNAYGTNLEIRFQRAPAGRMRAGVFVQDQKPVRIPNGTRSVLFLNRNIAAVIPTVVFSLHL